MLGLSVVAFLLCAYHLFASVFHLFGRRCPVRLCGPCDLDGVPPLAVSLLAHLLTAGVTFGAGLVLVS